MTMPLFNNIFNKLSQVNLSDINHELGKAKESLVYETGNYFGNFKSDAGNVGSLIRSESTKFSSILGSGAKTKAPASLPKSTSLPVIQGMSPDQVRHRTKLGSKYKYRSSYCEQDEDDAPVLSPESLMDDENIVNKFIKVVGNDHNTIDKKGPEEKSTVKRSSSMTLSSTREDIRKKLASFGEEETIPEEDEAGISNNLEICFINETASDEEEDVMINPLVGNDEDEDDESECNSISNENFMPRSKSDWDAFKTEEKDKQNENHEIYVREKQKIQAIAKQALAQCKFTAKRQLILEKQKRANEDPLKRILGITSDDINQDILLKYNINTLQVILNDFREKIEQHSGELVKLLIQKDDLETEQDSMLIDIEDISHSNDI